MPGRSGLYLGGYLGPTTYLGGPQPLGIAGETSSATPLRLSKRRAVAQAVEAELARPITRRKLRRFGQAGETSSALHVTPLKRRRIGPGLERQRARPMRRRRVLEPVVEHELAQPMRPRKVRRLGQAVELSTVCSFVPAGYGTGGYGLIPYGGWAPGSGRRKRRKVGVAKERQRAQRITPS